MIEANVRRMQDRQDRNAIAPCDANSGKFVFPPDASIKYVSDAKILSMHRHAEFAIEWFRRFYSQVEVDNVNEGEVIGPGYHDWVVALRDNFSPEDSKKLYKAVEQAGLLNEYEIKQSTQGIVDEFFQVGDMDSVDRHFKLDVFNFLN